MRGLAVVLSIIILGMSLGATASSQLVNSTQLQQAAQQIPPPPSNLFQEILYYIAQGYNWLVGLIQNLLQSTLLKADPGLASAYANIIAWLVPLTALYILLTLVEVARKFLGYLILAGWAFLILVLVLAR